MAYIGTGTVEPRLKARPKSFVPAKNSTLVIALPVRLPGLVIGPVMEAENRAKAKMGISTGV